MALGFEVLNNSRCCCRSGCGQLVWLTSSKQKQMSHYVQSVWLIRIENSRLQELDAFPLCGACVQCCVWDCTCATLNTVPHLDHNGKLLMRICPKGNGIDLSLWHLRKLALPFMVHHNGKSSPLSAFAQSSGHTHTHTPIIMFVDASERA